MQLHNEFQGVWHCVGRLTEFDICRWPWSPQVLKLAGLANTTLSNTLPVPELQECWKKQLELTLAINNVSCSFML